MISVGLTYFLEKLIEKNFIDNSSVRHLIFVHGMEWRKG